jgi:hypothetical protein
MLPAKQQVPVVVAQALPTEDTRPATIADVEPPAPPSAQQAAAGALGEPVTLDPSIQPQPADNGLSFILPGYDKVSGNIVATLGSSGLNIGGRVYSPDLDGEVDGDVSRLNVGLNVIIHDPEGGRDFLQSLNQLGQLASAKGITIKELLIGYEKMVTTQDGTQPTWYAELSVGQQGEIATHIDRVYDIFGKYADGTIEKLASIYEGSSEDTEVAPWVAKLVAGYRDSIPLDGNLSLDVGARIELIKALAKDVEMEGTASVAAKLNIPLDEFEKTVAYIRVMAAATTADRFAGENSNVALQGAVGVSHRFSDALSGYLEAQASNLTNGNSLNGGVTWFPSGREEGWFLNGNVRVPFESGDPSVTLGTGYQF